ncbi:L,D-transpeptidase [Nitrosomonas sp. JL21]|uniref:L,D-transpeptidase family protein n=1 Tax=Nitrosomonas sp. JL21 TaxID=153949 RepID=UPI001370D6A7|nr:L,D-transpeptidase family protein [Nitrosomonas sp. JL21]MBL8497651.1 L,D-transpeptidase family protein [Nitrosomonas sp.]MXS78890.1 L,D-transpeptidase [Nitrosomonas sp. JL21]
MYRFTLVLWFLVFSNFAVSFVRAETWVLPPPDIDIFGQIRTTHASREETLLDIARQYDIGQIEILLANPTVDRWLPQDGAKVILPNRYIIPHVERKGLVLNLPEMRIYYFPESGKGEKPVVITHPVGIGRMDWVTPLGISKIVEKKKDPTWIPPKSLQMDRIANGEQPYPSIVPPGPTNPLGRHAMRLSIGGGSYLIHGTIKPFGVGMRVSAGCVRMYPEDIEALFDKIPIGTQVHVINQPVKLGWLLNSLFIELHPPLEEDEAKYADYKQMTINAINDFLALKSSKKNMPEGFEVDQEALRKAIIEKSGIPVLISRMRDQIQLHTQNENFIGE